MACEIIEGLLRLWGIRTFVAASAVIGASLLGCGSRPSSATPPVACNPTRELLKNGGFEAGWLDAFSNLTGAGAVVQNVGSAATCPEPSAARAPRRGRFAFSSTSADGARPEGAEIGVQQVLSTATLGLSPGDYLAASAFVAGSCARNADTGGQLVVGFYRGGPDGEELGQLGTDFVNPSNGEWQQLVTQPQPLPPGTDTVVFVYHSIAPSGQAGELWADDLSLAVCGSGEELEAWRPLPTTPPETPHEAVAATPGTNPPEEERDREGTSAPQREPSEPAAAAGARSLVTIEAKRPSCLSRTVEGVTLSDSSCAHEITPSLPAGDYELAYSVRHWTGKYGLWLAGAERGPGDAEVKLGFDRESGLSVMLGRQSLPVAQSLWTSVSARIRMVRAEQRLLVYVNENLLFARPVQRVEQRLGFWNQGGSPRLSGISLRSLSPEEVALYRAAPETPTAAAIEEQKKAEPKKERTITWSSRLTFDLGDNHGAEFEENEGWTKNGLSVFHARLEAVRLRRLAGPLAYAYGLNVGYFSGNSSICNAPVVCTSAEDCTCQEGGARWSTRGVSYGPTVALALPALGDDGQGAILWLPILKGDHLITKAVNRECDGSSDCPPSDWSFGSASFELSAGADWIYRGVGGCGPRVTLGYYFGDLALRQDLGLVVTYGLSFHAATTAF